jgi:Ca2+-binding EF-hand superfamily protein
MSNPEVPPPTASQPEVTSPGDAATHNFLRQFRDVDGSRQFRQFTATQFMEVWSHYDADGNGYIDGHELDSFLREFIGSVNADDVGPETISETALQHMRSTFMDAFDENCDNKIDIVELSQILPMDENFLLLFRRDSQLESSVDFMKVWRQFDKDCSGHIDADELKEFLRHLLKLGTASKSAAAGRCSVSDERLDEYTRTVLQLFDSNKDGKLQLSEMARLLPVRENYLSRPIFKGATRFSDRDIDRILDFYDKDKNGTIENDELSGFLKDLVELASKDYNAEDIQTLESIILDHWDVNRDGSINKSELKMLLLQQRRLASHEQTTDSC